MLWYKIWTITSLSICALSVVLAYLGRPNTALLCLIWAVFFKIGAVENLLILLGKKEE